MPVGFTTIYHLWPFHSIETASKWFACARERSYLPCQAVLPGESVITISQRVLGQKKTAAGVLLNKTKLLSYYLHVTCSLQVMNA